MIDVSQAGLFNLRAASGGCSSRYGRCAPRAGPRALPASGVMRALDAALGDSRAVSNAPGKHALRHRSAI